MEYLTQLVLRLPAVLIAICMHESAHGWVANRCGDPTARLMGRITLNPVKHFDPAGMLCLVFFGVGWAKPVPINPLHFRNYRKDDLKVSLAGVTMNLILALVFLIPAYAVFTRAFVSFREMYYLPYGDLVWLQNALMDYPDTSEHWLRLDLVCLQNALVDYRPILETWGSVPAGLYTVLANVVLVNLRLAIFNLIPLPPLDGYHVLNDLVLKRSLFATQRAAMAGQGMLILLMVTDILPWFLNWALSGVLSGVGHVAYAIVTALGVL